MSSSPKPKILIKKKVAPSSSVNSIPIYKVKITEICTGMRIEGYDCNCYMFTDKAKALKFSYEKACKFAKNRGKGDVKYDEEGEYIWENEDYSEWEEFGSCIECGTLNLGDDIIDSTSFDG